MKSKLLLSLALVLSGVFTGFATEIRVRNDSTIDFKNVVVGGKNYDDIKRGATTDYQTWEKAYRYSLVSLLADSKPLKIQPEDYVGESPLGDGHFTYALRIQDGRLDIRAEEDKLAPKQPNWMKTKVTLYRATGEAVQLEAKRAIFTNTNGQTDFPVIALFDSKSGKGWIGVSVGDTYTMTNLTAFYVETDSGIVAIPKALLHATICVGDTMIPKARSLDDLIEQFEEKIDGKRLFEYGFPAMDYCSPHFRFWFFYPQIRSSIMANTPIENVHMHGGEMRLDFTSSAYGTPGSVWVDLKTWKITKAVENRLLKLELLWGGFAAAICFLIFVLRKKFKP